MQSSHEFSETASEISATLLLASQLFEVDDSVELGFDEADDLFDQDADTIAELLELSAINWELVAMEFNNKRGPRGPYTGIPKSVDFFPIQLRAPDRWFRQMFRVGRDTFDRLVALLAPDKVFQSTGRRPQRHVKYQLGCFLVRYGQLGADTLDTARKLGIGQGTVPLYCCRVSRALRRLKHRVVVFPNLARQKVIAAAIEERYNLPGCIGSGDGSLIPLTSLPPLVENNETFYCRKKYPATNLQATVDHEHRITSYEIGFPGSVPDVTIFKTSFIWKNRRVLFFRGHYFLMDKGYPSSPYVLRPFDEPEIAHASPSEQQRMRWFNKTISSFRIGVEHTFGMLKGRFPSLKLFSPHRNIEEAYKAIEALIILHNLCINWNDKPEDILGFNPSSFIGVPTSPHNTDGSDDEPDDEEELAAEVPDHETDRWLKEEGRKKRMAIMNWLYEV